MVDDGMHITAYKLASAPPWVGPQSRAQAVPRLASLFIHQSRLSTVTPPSVQKQTDTRRRRDAYEGWVVPGISRRRFINVWSTFSCRDGPRYCCRRIPLFCARLYVGLRSCMYVRVCVYVLAYTGVYKHMHTQYHYIHARLSTQ